MAFYTFQGKLPSIGEGTFIHPEASVIGAVTIGKNCFIAPGARLRGDWGTIIIGDDCNIQDNCIIHTQPGKETRLGNRVHFAHGSILHNAILEDRTFVGMNCLIMDHALLKEGCCIGAGSLVPEGQVIEEDILAIGSPVKIFKPINNELRNKLNKAISFYMALPQKYILESALI